MPRGIKLCKSCGSDKHFVRINAYDAIACRNCGKWCETRCSDPKCEFCSGRGEGTSDVQWDDPRNTVY